MRKLERALGVLATVVSAAAALSGTPATPPADLVSARATPEIRAPMEQEVRVAVVRGGSSIISTLSLEEYVAGVVAGEAAMASALPGLEALAVTVRTFAIANLGRHRTEGFDFCDLTHCQVLRQPTGQTRGAAASSLGRILLYGGRPAQVFYTASCGGRSEVPSAVWPGAADPPYLSSRDDPACAESTPWVSEIPAIDLERALTHAGFHGDRLRDLRVIERDGSGRVARLGISGFAPAAITGQDLRMIVGRTLGWQLIRSTAFEVRPTAIGYRFAGRGSGHGVGMCVIGSARMAAQGRSVTEILDAYFPGVPLGPIPAFRVDRSFAVVKPGSGLGKRTCPAWARWSAGRQPL